jgi:urease gamma subunit
MISVQMQVKGEPDTLPFAKEYHYRTADEVVFFNGEEIIQERLRRGLKINTNEALTLYCAHIVKGIRSGKSNEAIQNETSQILGVSDVMIGTPETLSLVAISAKVDKRPEMKITLKNPIAVARRLVPN